LGSGEVTGSTHAVGHAEMSHPNKFTIDAAFPFANVGLSWKLVGIEARELIQQQLYGVLVESLTRKPSLGK
jgi:hypothetical protein